MRISAENFALWADRLRPPQEWRCQAGEVHYLQAEPELLYAALHQWPVAPLQHLVVVCDHLRQAEALVADLLALESVLECSGREPVLLPELETDRKHLLPENEAERSRVLKLTAEAPRLFVTSVMAATAPAPPPARFREAELVLRVGDKAWPPERLAARLVELDYDNEAEVHLPGEFSWRGGLLDCFSPAHPYPVRLDYFGNELEAIRFFDPETQRSLASADSFTLIPRGEATLQDEEAASCFLDYLPPDHLLLVVVDPPAIAEHLAEYGDDAQRAAWQRYLQAPCAQLHTCANVAELPAQDQPAWLYPAFSLASAFRGLLPELEPAWESHHHQALATQLTRWHEDDYQFLICCSCESKEARCREFLATHLLHDLRATFRVATLSCGLLLPAERAVLLTDAELFGKAPTALPRRRQPPFHADYLLREGTELTEGDFAVHAAYGICRFRGLRTKAFHDREQEVLELEFADDAKIYVPLAQAYLVSRYVGSGKKYPKLSRIGTAHWKNTRTDAESAIGDLAAELIRIQAMRAASPGFAFAGDEIAMKSFADAFPYTETDDQLRAIDAVLQDMGQPRPMDRLICGDVGFGKTEVAMRAAFQAVASGKQVAVLVPTTVLSQQHYLNFCARFRDYPVIIENLSRFLTPHRQRQLLDAIHEGRVDIVIGTHRLLSYDVHFKDLGLLIVDEEQRFGVKHKERLKRLRADIDILTMTATPIPRTLYMSLAGLRDLSTIVTPPQERLPVQTVVAQYDETLIVEAIRRELQREGQVFYLHNRVQTIEKTAARLHALVPEARIRIAHGQMAEGELEAAMLSFIDGQEDVLLCTTIIESGVDIPNTNTIIIERADMFGLAELYQLRGRVGRYHRQAYAYLLIPRQGLLLDNARKRLAAIRKYTQLGAGFKLALRDLEIRGAGNILGAEQSGHIAAIGFDLYCQLLREAVSRLKQQPLPARPTAPLDVDFVVFGQSHDPARVSACIPHEYLREETLRVSLYRRLSEAGTLPALDDLAAEIADRFGAPPPEVQALLQVMRVRVLAHQAGVHAVTVRDGKVMLESAAGYLKDHQRLMPRLTAKTPADRLTELVAIIARYAPRNTQADRASA